MPIPSAADRQSVQQLAQCESKAPPRSFRGRIKDKGRKYLNQFKPPGLFHSYTKELGMVRWMSDPLKEKVTGFRREVAPVPDEEDQFAKLDAKLLQDPPPEYQATNVTQGQQALPQPESERPLSLGLQQTESMPLLRAETPTKKTQSIWQLPDRLKEYTTSIRSVARRERRVTSAPVGHFSYNPGSTDLAGIGTQYGSANKSATALQPNSNDLEMSNSRPNTPDNVQNDSEEPAEDLYSHPQTSTNSFQPLSVASGPCDSGFFSATTENPSERDLPIRRASNDTVPTSIAESIFSWTRPSSTISSATSNWDVLGRTSSQVTRASVSRKHPYMMPSSSVNNSRDSHRLNREHDLEDYPLPIIPVQRSNTATPPRPISSWIACLDHSVSDQVTAAGWVAQQRRIHKNRMPELYREGVSIDEEPEDLPDPDECPEDKIETASKSGLSTIDEQGSEAGCSHHEAVSMRPQSSGEHTDNGYLTIPRTGLVRDAASSPETDNMTSIASICSKDQMDQDTPGTSVADHPELERLDEVDSSDADESMSEVSHETDESFLEAFDATSLDPALLAAAVTLKDRIASLVLAKVIEWVRSCSPGQFSGNDSPDFGGAGNGDGDGRGSGGRGGAGKKRGREDGDGATGPGRGNDGDKDKRRKTEITPVELVPNLACPFVKGYPNKKWPCCEKKGWPSVHRIKEHIYRRHKVPIHCDRCFSTFTTEKSLKDHRREAVPCKVNEPCEMLGIDAEMKERLKCRKGIKNATEEAKWEHMYKILFPEAENIPSPYCDLQTLEAPMPPEVRAQYRSFIRREIPDRVIRELSDRLRNMPEIQSNPQLDERRLSEMISTSVWDAFDTVMPSMTSQTGLPTGQSTPDIDAATPEDQTQEPPASTQNRGPDSAEASFSSLPGSAGSSVVHSSQTHSTDQLGTQPIVLGAAIRSGGSSLQFTQPTEYTPMPSQFDSFTEFMGYDFDPDNLLPQDPFGGTTTRLQPS
ncbi:hypothetical protein NCS57_00211500 [Fusarium keratoplasticum]|uniref:Uncharacterized protein n=1 Tax=Fusarium keratoplasticum TaxID=1328300 RepID=A0ACC0R9Z4_9HYPO|nr:hypothetical protein NCS57_00211500 [Fusarium keratoplasticum]KAI8679336.1 hypothetical protein NCS57_00211500 [Fusarium keratoplasticum]